MGPVVKYSKYFKADITNRINALQEAILKESDENMRRTRVDYEEIPTRKQDQLKSTIKKPKNSQYFQQYI